MMMYANEISFPDDIQVVGPISLNTRKNKRNLQKIAASRAKSAGSAPRRAPSRQWSRRPHPEAPTVQAVVPVAQTGTARALFALPADALALLTTFTGLAGASALASCTASTLAFDGDFWRALVAASVGPRGGLSTALAASLAVDPRDGFRRWVFGLEGDWLRAFQGHARSHVNALEVLQHAEYLCCGLVRADAASALPFARSIAASASACEEELDAAREALTRTAGQAEARKQVFCARSRRLLRESESALAEKAMLARFALADDAPTFDYFEPWGEETKQTIDADVSLELAQNFLAVMEQRAIVVQ